MAVLDPPAACGLAGTARDLLRSSLSDNTRGADAFRRSKTDQEGGGRWSTWAAPPWNGSGRG